MEGTVQELGVNAERYACNILRAKGFSVKTMRYKSPFDLLCNGKRVEVKVARLNSRLNWSVNIHRHGQTDEKNVDVYIFLLDLRHLGKKKPLALIREAPVGSATVNFSLDSLLTIHNGDIENWLPLGEIVNVEAAGLRQPVVKVRVCT